MQKDEGAAFNETFPKRALLTPDQLAKTIKTHTHESPLLVSVLHDGACKKIDGIPLERNPESGPRDQAASYLAIDAYREVIAQTGQPFSLLVELISRAYFSQQIFEYFVETAIEMIKTAPHHPTRGRLVLDVHGFGVQPKIGQQNFDIVIGTGHRQTVAGSNVDAVLAEFMRERGYIVYLPTETPQQGELYGAKKARTIPQQVLKRNLPQTYAMQIEIARKFRSRGEESLQLGQQLSRDLAEFILFWQE